MYSLLVDGVLHKYGGYNKGDTTVCGKYTLLEDCKFPVEGEETTHAVTLCSKCFDIKITGLSCGGVVTVA